MDQHDRTEVWEASARRKADSEGKAVGGSLETDRPATTDRAEWSLACGAVPDRIGKYRVQREIARGGMGVVVSADDPDLGRVLAIKVSLQHAISDAGHWRFIEEARTTGKLQHPGVPPVHDVGRLPDGRPYFVMKLVAGETLAALLARHGDARPDGATLLDIFSHICQTVAYAHSRGVIHRDLKPLNVMVGAFGEVQVMDWGLAKTLGAPSSLSALSKTMAEVDVAAPTPPAAGEHGLEHDLLTVPVPCLEREPQAVDERGLTHDGTVLGTPAYMAPEQARGELDSVSRASDVFGLGAILCEMLTGKAPFAADRPDAVLALALRGELTDARKRLDESGTDPELVDLAKRCLAESPADRPTDASQVAAAVERHQHEVQERLRQTELRRAQAEVQVVEYQKRRVVERQRHRLWLSLAGMVLLLVCGAAGTALWYQRERVAREAEQFRLTQERSVRQQRVEGGVLGALDEADRWLEQIDQRLADDRSAARLLSSIPEWQSMITAATAAQGRADKLLDVDATLLSFATRERLERTRTALAASQQQWALAQSLDQIRIESSAPARGRLANALAEAPNRYHDAFARADFSPFGTPEEAESAAARIRQSPIRFALVAALDHWALVTLMNVNTSKTNAEIKQMLAESGRLLEVARWADPDPWRDQARDLGTWLDDPARLTQLAETVDLERQSPQLLDIVARFLPGPAEIQLRQRALLYHPGDFYLTFNLAFALPLGSERENCLQAALAIRPQSSVAWNNLAWALAEREEWDRALVAAERSLAIDPQSVSAMTNRGNALANLGRSAEAIQVQEQVLARQSDSADLAATHANLALALVINKELERGLDHACKAVGLKPDFANGHVALGYALLELRRWDEAVAAYQSAAELDAANAVRLVAAYQTWGRTLLLEGRSADAVVPLRKATELSPTDFQSLVSLAQSLRRAGDCHEAVRTYARVLDAGDQQAELERLPGLDKAALMGDAARAAWTACEQAGQGDGSLSGEDAARMRQHARDWLTAAVAHLRSAAAQPETDKTRLRQIAASWVGPEDGMTSDSPDGLTHLPAEELAAWQSLWTQVRQFATSSDDAK